jgi:hypothetical protein
MKVVAVKSVYINKRGSKKIKILTKGKNYNSLFSDNFKYTIVNDLGFVGYYEKSIFTDLSSNRVNKLKEIGL